MQNEEGLRAALERTRVLERDVDAATLRAEDLFGKLQRSEEARKQAAETAAVEMREAQTQKADLSSRWEGGSTWLA